MYIALYYIPSILYLAYSYLVFYYRPYSRRAKQHRQYNETVNYTNKQQSDTTHNKQNIDKNYNKLY